MNGSQCLQKNASVIEDGMNFPFLFFVKDIYFFILEKK